MKITRVGYNHIHLAEKGVKVLRPCGLSEYVLVITKTPFVLSVNNSKPSIFPENTVILFDPNTAYNYTNIPNIDYTDDYIHFVADAQEIKKYNLIYNKPINSFSQTQLSQLSGKIFDMMTESRIGDLHSEQFLSLQLEQLMIMLCRFLTNRETFDTNHFYYQTLSDARDRFLNQLQNHIDINQLANEVNMSASNFRNIYKKIFKISPQEDLIIARIEHAKSQLINTDYTVEYIALMLCGYNNVEHFTRQFKQHVGISPNTYRSLHQKNNKN